MKNFRIISRTQKAFVVTVVSLQMTFAGDALLSSFRAAMGKWNREIHQSLTDQTNQILANSDKLREFIKKEFSKKDQLLINSDLDQVSPSLLSQVKVTLENNKHIISIPFKGNKVKKIVVDLSDFPQGYLAIDKEKISLEDLSDYTKVKDFVYKKYSNQKKTSWWQNFILSTAYAQAFHPGTGTPGPVALVSLIALAIGSTVAIVLIAYTDASRYRKSMRQLEEYKNLFEKAIPICESDKGTMGEPDIQSQPVSNETLRFMERINGFFQSGLGHDELPIHSSNRRASSSGRSFSCRSPKLLLLMGKSESQQRDREEKVGEVCTMARALQDCLDEVAQMIGDKNLTVDNSGRHNRRVDNGSAYDDIMETLSVLQ